MRKAKRNNTGGSAELDYGALVKEGLLEKQSPSGFKRWQERTFRLHQNALVYSAPNNWAPSDKQRILLGRIDSIQEKGREFEIVSGEVAERGPYKLRAPSDTDAKAWITAIEGAKIAQLSGKWAKKGQPVAQITGNNLTWQSSGTTSPLFVQEGAVSIKISGKRYTSIYREGRIYWSDGDVWEPMAEAQPIGPIGPNGRFKVEEKLGAGCFGDVYRGVDTTSGTEMALKLEKKSSPQPQLKNEAQVLQLIKGNGPDPPGFTIPFFYFDDPGPYNALAIPLLGKALEDCVEICGGTLKPKSVLMIAEQLVRRLEFLHSKEIIHRDIKPGNFMWGIKEKEHHLYLIDFGLSERWWIKGAHVKFREDQQFTGTVRYASITSQRGVQQSRRDDLEAVGYMLAFFPARSLALVWHAGQFY